MYRNAFIKLELDEVATILDHVNPALENTAFDPIETTIIAQNLSFYPGHRILEISDHSVLPVTRRFVVYSLDNFTILDFSNGPIYALNHDVPITLNTENVYDYVRFFFTYVRGRYGRFIITESVEDMNWRDDPPPVARKAVGKLITPLTLEKMDENGVFHLKGCMVFRDSLFKSHIKVEPEGLVSLSDEELLIEDIPLLDDTFGQ